MRDTGTELSKYKIAVFTASVDDADTNKKFAESLQVNYPILSDPDKKVATAYGVMSPRGFAQRWTFIIDDQGIIRAIDTQVQAGSHGADLVKELNTLGVPKR